MNVVVPFMPKPLEKRWTLADQAEAINREFDRLDRTLKRIAKAKDVIDGAEWRASHLRLNAGQYLVEAKKLLAQHQPGASFEAWCAANVKRNMRDCYKCMAIFGSEDPERAEWEARAKIAESVAEYRNPQNQSAAIQDSPVEQQSRSVQTAIGLYRNMTPEQRNEVKAAQKEIDNAT